MSVSELKELLLWSTVINYGIVIFWVVLSLSAGGWFFPICGKWFGVTLEQMKSWNYGGIMIYKVGIMLFNLAPLLALLIAGSK